MGGLNSQINSRQSLPELDSNSKINPQTPSRTKIENSINFKLYGPEVIVNLRYHLFKYRIYPEGADWAKRKGVFKMWIEHGLASSKIYIIWIMNPCSVHRCKIWSLPILARVLNLLWRAAIIPQIVHTNSPTAPIWNIFNGVEFLFKNTIATKVKENGWVAGVLWGFEPFSHGNYHIRA